MEPLTWQDKTRQLIWRDKGETQNTGRETVKVKQEPRDVHKNADLTLWHMEETQLGKQMNKHKDRTKPTLETWPTKHGRPIYDLSFYLPLEYFKFHNYFLPWICEYISFHAGIGLLVWLMVSRIMENCLKICMFFFFKTLESLIWL